MKLTYSLNTYLLIVLLSSGYLMIFTLPLLIIGIEVAKYFTIVFVVALFLSILIVANISRRAKVVLRKHYGIDVKKGIWRTADFDTMQTQMLITYLESKNVYSKEKLEKMIIFLEKEIQRSKTPSFLAPSIFIALFIPAWSQSIIFLFKGIKNDDINQVILLIAALMGVSFFIALAVGTYKKIIHMGQDFFMIESNIKKKFLLEIEDLILKLPDVEANMDVKSNVVLIRSRR
ncbi:hypothetical protein [Paenibacillus solani]|nr:hypothetical protein [Paenibacillus solani]